MASPGLMCSTPERDVFFLLRTTPAGPRGEGSDPGLTLRNDSCTSVQYSTKRGEGKQMANTFCHIQLATGDLGNAKEFYGSLFD